MPWSSQSAELNGAATLNGSSTVAAESFPGTFVAEVRASGASCGGGGATMAESSFLVARGCRVGTAKRK